MRVLVVAVNAAYFALPIDKVRQVVRRPTVTRVPLSPAGLIGVINVRGEIIPLLDTGVLTGTGGLTDPPFAVLVSGAEQMLAVAAEELPVRADLAEPVGPGTHAGEIGMYNHEERLVMLIDIEELAKNPLELKRAS